MAPAATLANKLRADVRGARPLDKVITVGRRPIQLAKGLIRGCDLVPVPEWPKGLEEITWDRVKKKGPITCLNNVLDQ
jgi:hypothetical protein